MKESPAATWLDYAKWLGIDCFAEAQLIRMVESCGQWLSAIKRGQAPRWLTLLGSCGAGKTHCAYKLWNYAQQKVHWNGCDFVQEPIYWPTFVRSLKRGNDARWGMRDDMANRWPVLLLDDIGAERDPNGFSWDELSDLLNNRLGKWTILTSNLTFKAISDIDARISSRMVRDSNILVEVQTQDYAERGKEEYR